MPNESMTDEKTDKAYAENAARYGADWLAQPPPDDMYALFEKYFIKNGTVADIGCGNGRDAGWLARHGWRVTGFDNAEELLDEARRLFPDVTFKTASLPLLAEISGTFDNVVCETVIMHLPKDDIPAAVENLLRITKSGGVLYLSWRVTEGADARHEDGRLYSAFPLTLVRATLKDCQELHTDEAASASSGKTVCRIIIKKT